jgi:hypothetical protein
MTSNQRGPLTPWATHALQWLGQRASNTERWSESLKPNLSPDWSLQLDSMKLESLVTVDQPRHGEYVLGLCTQN